jgi:radical SAM superfamily enzyme with C-terminal helix-hairpin-helix motif
MDSIKVFMLPHIKKPSLVSSCQMNYTILDCYTDEASGLGVPPYLGTYPRYIYGMLKSQGHDPNYLTIDDLRLLKFYQNKRKPLDKEEKTNIRIYNATRTDCSKLLYDTDVLIVILGVHVPGKYLSALPGTIHEIIPFIKDLRCRKILTGPGIFGTQLEGGKYSERQGAEVFDEIKNFGFEFGGFDGLQNYALEGVGLMNQIDDLRIIEIETGRGCNIGRCSFCTEPLKNRFLNRKTQDILEEVEKFYHVGCRHFRLGKQSDFYSIEDPIGLLKSLRDRCPEIKVLHIDNVNPVFVVAPGGIEKTKAIVKYCTEGNIAAFGVESFDPEVVKANLLNCTPETAMKAIRIINEHGSERGYNGMPKFLPGINIIFGLAGESRKTHEFNMQALKDVYDEGLMLRRINIRQAAIFPGTYLEKLGPRSMVRNKKFYWKWREDIRQNIDLLFLKRLLPVGSIVREAYSEIYDGNTTFMRQVGTYPLIIGVKGRHELKRFFGLKITNHMLRSVTGQIYAE